MAALPPSDQQPDGAPATSVGEQRCPACGAAYPEDLTFCPKDGSRLTAGKQTSSLVGQVLADRYRIVRKLGEGGMGEVFEAQHVYIDKRFAIKTLRAEIVTSPDAVARFHQEARAASSIGHDNICEVDDFGRLPDGGVYLAMEFLEGESLGQRMHGAAALSLAEGLGYVAQACRGLAAAHQKGIIHRDVKPDNIFLARKSGRTVVKILDFGIAKMASDGSAQQRLTQTGAVFGTPHYMSPEQALGKPLDVRSDIYSMGVILYELCAGHVPFDGNSFMGILTQHIMTPPRPPREVAPAGHVPELLEAVVLRAMAKEPAERYPSMSAVADELERILDQSGLPMPPVEAGAASRSTSPAVAAVGTRTSQPRAAEVALEANGLGEPRPASSRRTLKLMLIGAAVAAVLGVVGLLLRGGGTGASKPGSERAPVANTSSTPMPGAPTTRSAMVGAGAPTATAPAVGAPAAAVPGAAPNATEVGAAPDATAPGAPGPTRAPSSAKEAHPVSIDTVPPGAQVVEGDRVLCTTPCTVQVASDERRAVTLRKEGYGPPRELTLEARAPQIAIELQREEGPGGKPKLSSKPPRRAPAGSRRKRNSAPPSVVGHDPYEALPPPTNRKPKRPPANAPLDPY